MSRTDKICWLMMVILMVEFYIALLSPSIEIAVTALILFLLTSIKISNVACDVVKKEDDLDV